MQNLIEGMPRLIQAGMGVHISSARLANATARLGALGVVSSAGLRHTVIEEVRSGDADVIATARTFPFPNYVEELLAFAPGGAKHRHEAPLDVPGAKADYPRRLSTIAAYVEVLRAKAGHNGKVGINVMWKCALTVLPSIYGAMLAGVDALLCGAGVPMEVPDIVAKLRAGEDLSYTPLTGGTSHVHLKIAQDNPAPLLSKFAPPKLLPILSNFAFPKRLLDTWEKNYGATPFAFVLENHAAGGHNAPPRNKSEFTQQDDLESYFDKVVALGVPVYVAGDCRNGGTRDDYEYWLSRGAYGLQVGSRFALCTDSGMRAELREKIIASNRDGQTRIETSPRFSPTGYPLKFADLEGTLADPEIANSRRRICNRGYLLQSHFTQNEDGTQTETYLCPAMPAGQYTRAGGDEADLDGRICLCNALFSTAGFYTDKEPPLVTLGLSGRLVTQTLSARQVIEDILTPEIVAAQEAALRV
jgi:NAD(P)H-dependent flavin oxidoreductase YrpB (nitropropane dioxygenase family)